MLAGGLESLRPLRPDLLALVAALLGLQITDLIYSTPAVTAWIKTAPWRDAVIISSAGKLLIAATMTVTVLDLSRREMFLVRGDLTAPGRIPLLNVTLPWSWLGPALILVVGGAAAALMVVALRPDLGMFRRIIGLMPIVLIFSAINAFGEEFTFRSVLLARLVPHVGGEQALWMTSVRFGLGHLFGNPSGPLGTIGATALGLMLGKSMLETKGFFWAGLGWSTRSWML